VGSRKKLQEAADGPEQSGLPPESGDAPLHELGRAQLSVFLYLALLPEETARLVKDWNLSQPGFRRDALGEVQRCDLVADAIRAEPESRREVLDLLRQAFGGLPLAAWRIDAPGAEELAALVDGEAGLAMVLWRLLADPAAEVRRAAGAWLDDLARRHFGPAEPSGGEAPGPAPGGRSAGEEGPEQRIRKLEAQLAAARRETEEERARAEGARRKEEEARERLQAQLREARAREAQAVDDAARAREASEAARRDLARAEAALAAARAEDSFAEAQRSRAQARELEGRVAALEARQERARTREEELERQLAAATRGSAPAAAPQGPERGAPAESGEPEAEGEEAQASWLFPVYTREFYDSLEGWDRRIQRAAFKQAHLLALDHRHPSLRALPLEGLPGYYRVRVATDVRLLYRRGERQNTVEILSLIDREDLDRYVRQAKTRS
jgi:mRNA-degrading endonuclease RelE of RelBE toxin-antitoxin system